MGAAYQSIASRYPRFPLATFPSPLERAPRLEAALRAEGAAAVPRIYLKRDDLLSLAFGGNKVRNLEFSIGQALADGVTDIATSGRQQSNHCRLTAAACVRAGLRAHLFFSGDRPAKLSGNLLLDALLGARLYFCGSDDRAVRERWTRTFADAIGLFRRRVCVLPVGGSDARGAVGHALAAIELSEQVAAAGMRIDAIALATATGGTQGGMLAGLRAGGAEVPVYGFAVAKTAGDLGREVGRLAANVAEAIGVDAPAAGCVLIDGATIGDGYGVPSPAGQAAAALLARTEGILADPVYTAKALAGLLAAVRQGRFRTRDTVVFIHTGGVPALFADEAPPAVGDMRT